MPIHLVATVSVRSIAKEFWPVAAVAFVCWISIMTCLDPAGSYPSMPEGPGLTVDEIFNVSQGMYLVEQSRNLGWLNLIPGTSQEAYRPQNGYNPDHPPLGRWWLGVHHHLIWWLAPPYRPEGPFVIACARSGSATAFALTVLIVGIFAAKQSGRAVGVMTAISLVLMPRVYGHAHLASLETITNLTWTASVLAIGMWWASPQPPTRKIAMFTGVLFGLALLTKIQAILIPIPVICWSVYRWRTTALPALALWGLTAFAVFFACWPYLWFDSFNHLLEYLGRTTNRATLQVWYLGEKYPDKLVPWHYPFVLFGLTVPVVLHGLGLAGLFPLFSNVIYANRNTTPSPSPSQPQPNPSIISSEVADVHRLGIREVSNSSCDILLLLCLLFPLFLFALPGIAVYDGERLFLTSFPLWAIFVGRGWQILWKTMIRVAKSPLAAGLVCSILGIASGHPLVTTAPCHLCYYNEITSSFMGGVDRAGLEVDYWGAGITRQLLKRMVEVVPERATVAMIPTLHQTQADDYRIQSPILRSCGIRIVEFHETVSEAKYLLAFRRRADLPEKWVSSQAHDVRNATLCQGHQLAFFTVPDE